uniref:Choline/carnitine acyltransferase domain-containing protein n=1 Tax=Timema bartmani TaxID=61472 RepID=A0A7R9I1D6_9NEOP|nr:unnamed protein product [Timema bartmani]
MFAKVGESRHKLACLHKRALPVERATSREKGQPLCMSQYYRLLTSYRCPGVTRDVIVSTTPEGEKEGGRTTPPPTGEHIIVSCRHQLYSLPVKTPDLGLMPEDEMTTILLAIMRDASAVPSPPPVVSIYLREERHLGSGQGAARQERVENHFGRKNLSTLDLDSNLDLLVIGSLVHCKSNALDHAATEVGQMRIDFLSNLPASFLPSEFN